MEILHIHNHNDGSFSMEVKDQDGGIRTVKVEDKNGAVRAMWKQKYEGKDSYYVERAQIMNPKPRSKTRWKK